VQKLEHVTTNALIVKNLEIMNNMFFGAQMYAIYGLETKE
jgi:hypothetical protein